MATRNGDDQHDKQWLWMMATNNGNYCSDAKFQKQTMEMNNGDEWGLWMMATNEMKNNVTN